jgi:hypothetical protein
MTNIETQNALTVQSHYAPAAIDAFDHDDPTESPIRGGNIKFDAGAYFTGKEKTRVETTNRRFVVLDKCEGWVFLKKGCQPEYVMWTPGTPKPEIPECGDECTWPLGLDGKPSRPWKWNFFVYVIDAESGETLTFSSNTVGGKIAVRDLTQQIRSMRSMKPGSMPVVELQSAMMATDWGKKPRPHFKITGWRMRDTENPAPATQIGYQSDDVVEVNEFDDSVPEF